MIPSLFAGILVFVCIVNAADDVPAGPPAGFDFSSLAAGGASGGFDFSRLANGAVAAGGRPPAGLGNLKPQPSSRNFALQGNFNASRYAGRWYEIYRTKNMPFESGTDVTATYTLKDDGSVGVFNKEWLLPQKKWNTIVGSATVIDPSEPAHLQVAFPGFPSGDYRVLYTDYERISVVGSSSQFGPIEVKMGWILCRTPVITRREKMYAFGIFYEKLELSRGDFDKTVHGVAPASSATETGL